MASESSGTDLGTKVFKFCTNIINIIFICAKEDQKITIILKMSTFIHLQNFQIPYNFVKLCSSFLDFMNYFNVSGYGRLWICIIFHGF